MKYKQSQKFPDWMLEDRGRGKSYQEYLDEVYTPYKRRKMMQEYKGEGRKYAYRIKEETI